MPKHTVDWVLQETVHDTKVKVAGVDIDGVLRGKLMSISKFRSVVKNGFGFCSVIFGWDMHDQTYFKELAISNKENGYRDILAIPDLDSFRRIPWEGDVPFLLVSFYDPDTKKPLSVCPRGLLMTTLEKLEAKEVGAMAGGQSASQAHCGVADRIAQPSTSSITSELRSRRPEKEEIRPRRQGSYRATPRNCFQLSQKV